MKQIIGTRHPIMVIVAAVLCIGIASEARAEDEVPFRVVKLLTDLNDTRETSAVAQEELIELGKTAHGGLLQEVASYKTLTRECFLSAVRCLRLLRRMKTDLAIDVAVDIVATLPSTPVTDGDNERLALVFEALTYLTENAKSPEARKAVFRFLGDDPAQAGWLSRDYLVTDVFSAVRLFVEKKDPEIGPWITKAMLKLPYRLSYGGGSGPSSRHLAPNGFVVNSLYHSSAGKDDQDRVVWPDPLGRPRVLCLTWLRDLKYVESLPVVAELLKSEHKDERDFALVVAEELDEIRKSRER